MNSIVFNHNLGLWNIRLTRIFGYCILNARSCHACRAHIVVCQTKEKLVISIIRPFFIFTLIYNSKNGVAYIWSCNKGKAVVVFIVYGIDESIRSGRARTGAAYNSDTLAVGTSGTASRHRFVKTVSCFFGQFYSLVKAAYFNARFIALVW